jgi:hypothetical protein
VTSQHTPMWATDLIEQVQRHVNAHGDCPVYVDTLYGDYPVVGTFLDVHDRDDEGVVVIIRTEKVEL